MDKYNIILDKLEKNPNVPMIIGGVPIGFNELKPYTELTKEEVERVLNENTNMPLNKINMIKILSDSYRERNQNMEIQNENLYQKTLMPNKPYTNNSGFIDVALFFFTVLTSALSIVTIMLFVIKSNL